MTRLTVLFTLAAALPFGFDCRSQQTTVDLVNNTSYTVDVQLFCDEEQDFPEDLIELNGTELNYSLAPGETRSFARDCDDLQAIFIKDAEMLVAPGISPEADTGVYRDSDDFSCGDTLIFTFVEANQGASLTIEFERSD